MLRNALQHETADHVPVLADEVRELLAVQPGETVVDATFGAGGHSGLILAAAVGGWLWRQDLCDQVVSLAGYPRVHTGGRAG